ncbi:MAG: aspartate carbamoyltransferase catalytic subunit [Marinosulfonomonas sp.]|nr:MAG: aspartate carbamoyltransferase catalytic subunit [Marinosulfonomonas sp.]
MSIAPTGWEDIFEEGEELLWQGRPDGAVVWQKKHNVTALMGLAVTGFGVFWIVSSWQVGNDFWVFGLGFLLLGPALAIAPPYMNAMMRRSTWYSLSNRRAFIATERENVGRKLAAYIIRPDFTLDYDGQTPGSIIFAIEVRQPGNSAYRVSIAFERISEAAEVYEMMRGIQEDTG